MNLDVLTKMIESATSVSIGVANEMVQNTDVKNLVSEIAEYQLHASRTAAVIAGIVILLSAVALVIGIKMGIKDDWIGTFPTVISGVAVGVLFIAFVVFVVELNDIYLAKYFPEKLFLREVRNLLGNL